MSISTCSRENHFLHYFSTTVVLHICGVLFNFSRAFKSLYMVTAIQRKCLSRVFGGTSLKYELCSYGVPWIQRWACYSSNLTSLAYLGLLFCRLRGIKLIVCEIMFAGTRQCMSGAIASTCTRSLCMASRYRDSYFGPDVFSSFDRQVLFIIFKSYHKTTGKRRLSHHFL